jgi:DNA polymerase III subunit epsilon
MTRRKKSSSSKAETALIGLIIGGIGLLIVGIFKGLYELFKVLTTSAPPKPEIKTPQYHQAFAPAPVESNEAPPVFLEEKGPLSIKADLSTKSVNFVAIDFETANRRRGSACAVGMCKVINGEVVDRYYTLLRPEPLEFEKRNTSVHGIDAWDVAKAPTIAEDWANIQAFVGDLSLVAHNASFDKSVLDNSLIANGLAPSNYVFDCTMQHAKRLFIGRDSYKLNDFCQEYGIPLKHHDAGSDAEGCARLWLELLKIETPQKKIAIQQVPSVSEPISDKLKGLTLVFTGEFDGYTREEIEDMAKTHGAFVRQTVSSKTDHVIQGNIYHSGKLTKAEELGVPIITLKNFIKLIEKPKKRSKELVH